RGAEVDGLLRRAALTVDGRCGGLDRKPLLEPRVARDVERLLAELLHAACDHVLNLRRIDARARDQLRVGAPDGVGWMGVLVVAFLDVSALDRGAHCFDDHDLAALLCHLLGSPEVGVRARRRESYPDRLASQPKARADRVAAAWRNGSPSPEAVPS